MRFDCFFFCVIILPVFYFMVEKDGKPDSDGPEKKYRINPKQDLKDDTRRVGELIESAGTAQSYLQEEVDIFSAGASTKEGDEIRDEAFANLDKLQTSIHEIIALIRGTRDMLTEYEKNKPVPDCKRVCCRFHISRVFACHGAAPYREVHEYRRKAGIVERLKVFERKARDAFGQCKSREDCIRTAQSLSTDSQYFTFECCDSESHTGLPYDVDIRMHDPDGKDYFFTLHVNELEKYSLAAVPVENGEIRVLGFEETLIGANVQRCRLNLVLIKKERKDKNWLQTTHFLK